MYFGTLLKGEPEKLETNFNSLHPGLYLLLAHLELLKETVTISQHYLLKVSNSLSSTTATDSHIVVKADRIRRTRVVQ